MMDRYYPPTHPMMPAAETHWKKVEIDIEVENNADVWICPRCFRVVRAPKPRTFEPNTICKHVEGWYNMVKLT